ncbi:MAG: DUF2934 domain-containing protein [Acidobacteriia bacterium]|nr:DUF2934 domain-containing protein [Terriglobia bacterium]
MPRAKTPRTSTTTNKPVITMPEPGSKTAGRKGFPGVPPVDMETQIRARAYELYQARGCTPGHENEDWFRAEQEVRARQNQQHSA